MDIRLRFRNLMYFRKGDCSYRFVQPPRGENVADDNPNVGQVISKAMKQAQGVLVMFSPDEDAKLKSKFCGLKDKKKGLDKLEGQARPNVLFEAGLALGAHPDKTLLVQVGDTRDISDIAGMHLINLSDDPNSRKELAQRLATKLKFKVDMTGMSWLSTFKFNR